ncbi:slipin family protein [Aliiroseovarius sp.]|uniref:slipin family protein n=1 Tax=Aliiroseovarius sp. TaxID=1872442 RepID=UPI003BABA583
MMRMFEEILGLTRLTVTETERVLALRHGQFEAILGPGEHRMRKRGLSTERHDLNALRFTSNLEHALFRTRADLARAHLTEVETTPEEVAVILRDGRPIRVLLPDTREVFWTDAGPWEVERHPVGDTLSVGTTLMRRLVRAGLTGEFSLADVAEGHVGMLSVDGIAKGQLAAGRHAFWRVGRRVEVRQVDLRHRSHEVVGQEVLTRDRVTLRLNLTAGFRVTDAEVATTAVKDFEEALHRALQLALRKTVGALTLDRLLAEKAVVEPDQLTRLRAEMAAIGIELGEVALKDVILPGEMRDILNAVVEAEKQAEASVIRRREETNATRALLNTAKLMADNPVMLRLKELEALEGIAGNVDRLTIHNGAQGLMSDLVRLSD